MYALAPRSNRRQIRGLDRHRQAAVVRFWIVSADPRPSELHPLACGVARIAAAAVGAHVLPSIASVPAIHHRLLPHLSGRSDRPHVALTFDDGPDPTSTPTILDELARLQVRATFFVLGAQLQRHAEVGRRIVDERHEVAVHGWRHRPHLLRTPWGVAADIARTIDCIRCVTGVAPRFWRPPNGVLTGAGIVAARWHSLQPVLWTADGRDWDARATPDSVVSGIGARLTDGGTVLLHDSDITSAPGSWRVTVQALPGLIALCADRGLSVGPLGDHWSSH